MLQGVPDRGLTRPERGAGHASNEDTGGRAFPCPGLSEGPRGCPPGHAQGHKGHKGAEKAHRGARGWSKGDVVPQVYRGGGDVVSDWRAVKLKAPPPGHRWIKVDGDYVQVAIATGIIALILLSD